MEYELNLQQQRHGRFIGYIGTAILIIVIASVAAAQTPEENQAESPLPISLSECREWTPLQ